MSGKKSEMTLVMEALGNEIEAMYQVALETMEIPFGMEKVDKETYRRRFKAMSNEQKAQEILRAGPDRMLEMFPEGIPWGEEG